MTDHSPQDHGGDGLVHEPLRVLVANQREDRIGRVTEIVVSLGHVVVVGSTDVAEVGDMTIRERPDVALVGLGDSSEHALELISRIVREAACPVIALLETDDAGFVDEAAKRGVFAYLVDGNPEQLQSALDIVLRRFAEYHNLEGAFGRRAVIERAKGILMERHRVDEDAAFGLLRDEARHGSRKVVDVAEAVATSHRLLPGPDPV
ncbi:MAG: ANTAR domain-containing response regulator [Gaiellaceae bacterium]